TIAMSELVSRLVPPFLASLKILIQFLIRRLCYNRGIPAPNAIGGRSMDALPTVTPPVPIPAQSIVLEAPAGEESVPALSVGSWALYDFANTIFSLNIVTNYFPLYIAADLLLPDAVYAYPMSAAMLVVALIMPALGALSDRGGGRRMPW